jgi:peptidoglycan L-alanyl-D-glutamate endopeptidase CwlK
MVREDKITLDRIKLLHPLVQEEALKIYNESNAALKGKAILRYAHTTRTFAEQTELYSYGRTNKSKKVVTWAKAGDSYHNYGLAIDIVLLVDTNNDGKFETASWDTLKDFDGDLVSDWMEVVKVFKKYGWEWGGDWKGKVDKPHFQKTLGYSISKLKSMYPKGIR